MSSTEQTHIDTNVTPILHVHVRDLSSDEFLRSFVDANRPVIIEGATKQWNEKLSQSMKGDDSNDESSIWTIERLQQMIGPLTMRNVFVASHQHRRRFKYFSTNRTSDKNNDDSNKEKNQITDNTTDSIESSDSTSLDESGGVVGLARSAMTFDQFVERSRSRTSDQEDAYYVGRITHTTLRYRTHQTVSTCIPLVSDPLLWFRDCFSSMVSRCPKRSNHSSRH